MFENEHNLVCSFIDCLEQIPTPWGNVKFGTEFNYQRGKTDLVAVSDTGNVIAFEAKLKKWKIALQQAYRNTCFADLSYVLLPMDSIQVALNSQSEFSKRGVGLCYITDENEICVVYEAQPSDPLQPWLRDKALSFVDEMGVVDDDRVRSSCQENMSRA